MRVNNEVLITNLIEKTKKSLNQIEKFNQLSYDILNYKENPSSWSILECISHLNIYGDFYLPEIEQRISQSTHKQNDKFKSGLLGDYFVKLIQPKEKLNKMKTLKKFDPIGSNLEKNILEIFKEQQFKMLDLLAKSRNTNLTKTKTGISISKFIKLRLGDTLRFVISHNQRHLNQAEDILKKAKR